MTRFQEVKTALRDPRLLRRCSWELLVGHLAAFTFFGTLLAGSEEFLERETGFEPATSTLARSHSTTELFPLDRLKYHTAGLAFNPGEQIRRPPTTAPYLGIPTPGPHEARGSPLRATWD